MAYLKRFEMSVEVTAVDGSQVFACMAENETEAEQMFKRGECEIIDQQIEVLGLEKSPFAIEESEDISSRLASDRAHAYFERTKALESASNELIKALRVHHGITLDHIIGAHTRKALQQLTDLLGEL